MEGLVDKTVINVDILRPSYLKNGMRTIFGNLLFLSEILKIQQWTDIEQSLLHGKSILFINGQLSALELDTQAAPKGVLKNLQPKAH